MPWKIYSDGKKHCIHKLNENGSKGERVGKCENSKKKAEARLAALYASESEKKSVTTAQVIIDDFPIEQLISDASSTTVSFKPITTDVVKTAEKEKIEAVTKAVTMGKKSFEQMINDVRDAWYDEYEYSGWVVEVFEKYFIAQKDKNLWKIPYMRSDDDIEIADVNEWQKVERASGYVAKYAPFLTAIKAIGDDTIGAYGILWGDEDHKDYHDEYFTKDTAEMKAVFEGMGALPFLFDHGFDNKIKSTVIGKVTTMEEDDIGLWFEAKITEHEIYKKMVKPLIESKMLYPSSGVLPAARRVKSTGQIVRWPIVEMTGTHRPAEYRMLETPIDELQKHFKSAGLPELEVEVEETDNGSEKERLGLELKQQELETRLIELTLEE